MSFWALITTPAATYMGDPAGWSGVAMRGEEVPDGKVVELDVQ
jgi:hypothetical protein